jgi:hypothetical protein
MKATQLLHNLGQSSKAAVPRKAAGKFIEWETDYPYTKRDGDGSECTTNQTQGHI